MTSVIINRNINHISNLMTSTISLWNYLHEGTICSWLRVGRNQTCFSLWENGMLCLQMLFYSSLRKQIELKNETTIFPGKITTGSVPLLLSISSWAANLIFRKKINIENDSGLTSIYSSNQLCPSRKVIISSRKEINIDKKTVEFLFLEVEESTSRASRFCVFDLALHQQNVSCWYCIPSCIAPHHTKRSTNWLCGVEQNRTRLWLVATE